MLYAFKICTYVIINKDKHFKWYIQSKREKWHLINMEAFTVGLNIDVYWLSCYPSRNTDFFLSL